MKIKEQVAITVSMYLDGTRLDSYYPFKKSSIPTIESLIDKLFSGELTNVSWRDMS